MSFFEIVGCISTIATALGALLQLHPKTREAGKALTHAAGMSTDGAKRLKGGAK